MKPAIRSSIDAIRHGRPVMAIYEDNTGIARGALLLAAENVTAASVNLMAREGRGVVCVGLTADVARRLDLRPMIPCSTRNENERSICTVSVDAKSGITTGISAGDRAHTLQLLAAPSSVPDDFVRPGHLFPYVTHQDGVLGRSDIAEASVDLARLAGLQPVGTFCGILDTDGGLAQEPYLLELAERAELPVLPLDDLIHYRLFNKSFITPGTTEPLETALGVFELTLYADHLHGEDHFLLTASRHKHSDLGPTVYVHRACLQGDVFGANRCSCKQYLAEAQQCIQAEGGMIIYVSQRAQDDVRAGAVAAHVLRERGIASFRLISPWARLSEMLRDAGCRVTGEIDPIPSGCTTRAPKEAVAL